MSYNQTVIGEICKRGGNYVLPVKENQKRLRNVIQEEIEKLEKEKTWKELDCIETMKKEHGRIEKVRFRMLSDTGFVYEKLGLESFYGTIARVGVMDKKCQIGGIKGFRILEPACPDDAEHEIGRAHV